MSRPVEAPDESLKKQVHDFWNSRPCGTQFTGLEWGDRTFFDSVERERYLRQPFMREVVGFDRYAGKKLLEIGCGLGTDTLQFARGGALTTGVDLTEESVALARKRFEIYGVPGEFRVADAENLPFPDATFDVVYSFGVLHHTPDTPKAVREVERVLKPGGRIVIMLYHRRSTHLWLGYPVFLLQRLRQGKSPFVSFDEYFRMYDGEGNPLGKAYTRSEVRSMFSRFENLEFETHDPHRPRQGALMNRILLGLGRRYGFWLIFHGNKHAAGAA